MTRALLVLSLVLGVALCATPALVAQDVDPPVIDITEGGVPLADGALFNRAVTPQVQVTDASPTTVDTLLDGAAFVSGTTVAGEGGHTLSVTATDDQSNTASATVTFTIDTVPPVFGAILPVSGTLTSAVEVTLQGQVTGATAVTVDGQSVTLVGQDFTAGPFPLSEGERSWTLVASDAAGNTAQVTHRVVRDATPPTISIDQPLEGTVRKASPVDVVGTTSDPHLLSVTVNGTTAGLTGSTFLSANVPLGEGSTQIVAEATDAAGNVAQATRTVVLDTQPPALSITDPAAGTVVPDGTITVSGTAADPHLDRVEIDGVSAQLTAGTWSGSATLTEGGNTVEVRAFDRLGWSTAATVSVVRDSQAPAIQIDDPPDGAYLQGDTVDVSGTVGNEAGLTVAVNGVAATLDTTPDPATFTALGVPLVEGENRLIARVTDSVGNQGAHTLLVYRDTVAPTFVGVDPGDGALAVPPGTVFELTFSEDLGTLGAGAWSLETTAGQAIAATGTVSGPTLFVEPQSDLPSATDLQLVLTGGIVDKAGNALAAPPTLTFTTLDVEAPAAPVLSAQPPGYLCASTVALSGTSEPEAIVRVAGGANGGQTRAASDGSFALSVELVPGRLNRLRLTATDQDGNTSPELAVEVVQDCDPPSVTGAVLENGVIAVAFSEPIAPASAGQAGAITVSTGTAAVAGTVSVSADGAEAVFTPDQAFPAEPVRLDVSRTVADLAGNPLAFPYSEIFGGTVTTSFVAGRVLDAGTGRPLAGVTAVIESTDGVALPAPQPEATTGADGQFRIPVASGTHALVVLRGGYTPAFRFVTSASGQGGDAFDPRLTPAASPQTVTTAGGSFAGADGLTLTVPGAALAADAEVAVTVLEEQALPALLPYGWSPRGAAWVDLDGQTLSTAGTLDLPVDAPDGAQLAFARLDLATLQWHVEAVETVAGGTISGPVAEETGYVAVEADTGSLAPPAAVVGTVLGSSSAPAGTEVAAAAISFDPTVVLPSQRSEATVGYTLASGVTEVPSGLPLTLSIQEELTLLDGTLRSEPSYEADLVLYHGTDGTPRSRFGLRPSVLAQSVPLELGAENVVVRPYAGQTVQGNVLGPAGGTVSTPEGDRVDLPAGAVSEPTAVLLDRVAEAALPVAVPAGTEYLGSLALDLSGRTLAAAASLTLELGAAPAAGEEGLLFELIDPGTGSGWAFRPVAQLAATATGWTTATIDPLDLPWPGVREEATYVFARLTAPVGYLRGTVFDVGGAPLAGALVSATSSTGPVPWLQVSGADGKYVLPAPVAALTVTAVSLTTGDAGSAATAIATADARVDQDLFLQVTGPEVVSVNPADGAIDVTPGIEPTVTFSEAVDATTVASGVLLYDGATQVPVTVEVQGALVRLRPQATLRPGVAHEVRVNTAIKDLQGNRLTNAVISTFTTLEITSNEQLDLTKVHLFEPDTGGMARVLGDAGAVPAGSLVFVENLSRLISTPSVTAGQDGGFDVQVEAALTDRLLLHVVITGQNEVVIELTPFLSTDGRGGYVVDPAEAVTFTTLDGVTVQVEAETFAQPTIVRVDPQPVESWTAPHPTDFNVSTVFDLDFGGAEALKPVQIALPLPAGLTGTEGPYLLTREETILGESRWMMYDLMRYDGTELTTEPDPEGQAAAATAASTASASVEGVTGGGSLSERSVATLSPRASLPPKGWKAYVPGAVYPGRYSVVNSTGSIEFAAIPLLWVQPYAYFDHLQIDGLVAKVNAVIDRFLAFDAILLPTREGEPFSIEGRDLVTGYKFYEATYDPPADGQILFLPSGDFADGDPPLPLAGDPLRFFTVTAEETGTIELADGIEAVFDLPEATGTLTVQGSLGAVGEDLHIRVVGLDDLVNVDTHSEPAGGQATPGDFSLSTPVEQGNRYLVAVGGLVSSARPVRISFTEGLPPAPAGIQVFDSLDRDVNADLEPDGDQASLRISLSAGWRGGETYTLYLGPELADGAGNAWGKSLELEFKVEATGTLDTLDLPEVRDVARLGSLLFVAAGADGLAVIDGSDPQNLASYVQGGGSAVYFPLPLNDPAYGVAADPHGRIFVVGGGKNSEGWIEIFDPLDLDLAAIAASPNDPALRAAAFNGKSVIADSSTKELAGEGNTLPAGTPRRVKVLSDDQTDRWRVGVDIPPFGITVSPTSPPTGGGPYEVTVDGIGAEPDHPVSLRDLDRGRWNRTDADASGAFSLTMTVEAGDTVELLRNQGAVAYVATLGVGIEAVSIEDFYNEPPEAPTYGSDIRGIYSGYLDPSLSLCDTAGDIAGATLDVGLLYKEEPPHPLTVVGLVGLRGLVFLDSPLDDVGNLSRFGDLCLTVDGSRAIQGLEVLENYTFDLDHDGVLEESEERDYLLVAHRTRGLLILDATNRDNVFLVSRIDLPGGAAHLGLDREARRVYVAGAGAGVYVVSLDGKLTTSKIDENSDGLDDRILETVPLAGGTLSPILLLPDLGLAYAGGLERGLTGLSIAGPKIVAIAENPDDPVTGEPAESQWRQVDQVAPFGVPTAPESALPGAEDLPGAFRLLAYLPGVAGPEVKLDLVSLGPGDVEIAGAGDPASITDLPPTSLTGADGVVLHRLSDNPLEEGYQIYLSEEVAAIADLRAASGFTRTTLEDDVCGDRCTVPDGAREILSGDRIAVRFGDSLRSVLEPTYGPIRLEEAQIELDSVRWDTSPSVRQEPTLNASFGTGDVAPGTLLHSGEMTHQATDLSVKSRGFDFAFTRTYRSQTVGAGPLGPGWDFGYHQRLRELPNGDVEYYDGRGRVETFEADAKSAVSYTAPPGRFVVLTKTSEGWLWIGTHRSQKRFDRYGRLVAIADAVKDSADTGNEMRFLYAPANRLIRIEDTLDREYRLEYDDDGRLTALVDFSGRRVEYAYDGDGRLITVTSPDVAAFGGGLVTTYAYATSGTGLPQVLTTRDQLTSITDPRGNTWLDLTWTDADADGRAEEVTGESWGGDSLSLTYDFAGKSTVVNDRRGNPATYRFDGEGRTTTIIDRVGETFRFAYDGEGNLTQVDWPSGRQESYDYETTGGRRSQGNRTLAQVFPGSGGKNGSSDLLSSPLDYHGASNRPSRITDPRGVVTDISRDRAGQPTQITRAAGTADATTASIEYNDFGQPTRLVNANGHVTKLEYYEDGPSKGYLKRRIVDPDALALTTTYETDERGNVTAVTDPRGFRHERQFNELDWPTAELEPSVGYRTDYVYDENGDLVEEHVPVGAGASQTKIVRAYGMLGELLSISAEVAPDQFVTQTREYDANRNVIHVTRPAGQVTNATYDERNLLTELLHTGPGLPVAIPESFSYDAERRPDRYVDGRGKAWLTQFDGYGRPMTTFDPLGRVTTSQYDDGGNPTLVERYTGAGCILGRSQTTFDPHGRPTLAQSWVWDALQTGLDCNVPPAEARVLSTATTYDGLGQVLSVIDPLGRIAGATYDEADRLIRTADPAGNVTTFVLDAGGNVTQQILQEQTPGGDVETTSVLHRYDPLGRRIETEDGLGNVTQWAYDARGHVIVEADPEGNLTVSTYDALDNLTSVTRPEGIEVDYGYDASSRLLSYMDALGNETTWTYDALDRKTGVTYADDTTETYEYDASSNLVRTTDPLGTVIDQAFDDVGRLTARTITPAAGVVGPTSETYTYDPLDRVIQAVSGSVTTDRTYDTLSRLLSETTNGRTVTHGYDDAGNPLAVGYPSGVFAGRVFDELNRPTSIGRTAALPGAGIQSVAVDPFVGYGFRGVDLVATKDLEAGGGTPVLSGSMTFDAARRMTGSLFQTASGKTVFGETLTWSPRSLKTGIVRADRNDSGLAFDYDAAGRLTAVDRTAGPAPRHLYEGWSFELDAAENLLERRSIDGTDEKPEAMPLDGSGRNRPASVDGVTLTWDANGNLVGKGDRTFAYDYRNRLTRVTGPSGTIASYTYDAFNRRVEKTVGGTTTTTTWDGWESLEESEAGTVVQRRTFGLGLDEIVRAEADLDGDGLFETTYAPVYDSIGNLVMVVGDDGRPIERYDYSPHGERRVLVNDLTPPAVEQIRVEQGVVWVELSEAADASELQDAVQGGAISLTDQGTAQPIALVASQPVTDGDQAGRRIVLTPGTPPAAGTVVDLDLQAGSLVDLFGNATVADDTESFTWPAGDAVVRDTTSPRVTRIAVEAGALVVELSEQPDLAAAASEITLDSQALTWNLDADGYTLRSTETVSAGAHTLDSGTGALDLAGLGLAQAFQQSFTLAAGETDQVAWRAADPSESAGSTVGNLYAFHGRPIDPETGFLYFRNRYYDPELGRFIQTDPLGYVDGPNLYQYGLNNPVNFSDPLGLQVEPVGLIYRIETVVDGQPQVYTGSTARELKQRLSGHKWRELLENPNTRVYTRQVEAELDVSATSRGTLRAARSEAVRGPEQQAMDETSTQVEESNATRAPGEPETKILNERNAARDPETLIGRHRVRVDDEWTEVQLVRGRGGRIMVRGMALMAIWDGLMYAIDEKKSQYTMVPYVLEDEGGQFKIMTEGLFVHDYSKRYITGPKQGEEVPVSPEEGRALKEEAEALWGTVDWKGDFVPGLLMRELPCSNCA